MISSTVLQSIADIWQLSSKQIKIQQNADTLTITLPFPLFNQETEYQAQVQSILQQHQINIQNIRFDSQIQTHQVKAGIKTLSGVKNVIAIASGKGGVGKSTVTAMLAMALAQSEAKVGVLDADLYGPSQGIMFGIENTQPKERNQQFIPIEKYGIQLMSMDFLVPKGQALVWRGPLISRGLQQLFSQTAWQDIDYLLVDMPPGTGDIQLTITQIMPLTAAVIVTTPQDIALADAQKAIDMFQKTQIPILGLLENMAIYQCPCCGHQEAIFGDHGGQSMAAQYNIPLMGQFPLMKSIREITDQGQLQDLPDNIAHLYQQSAQKITQALAKLGKDYSRVFPQMVVEKK
ncbi:MAG: Mrp/NBP35 family ATP-binding protein [Neisseriaceae bacterium]|nr:Mrp/NBP35 family ATP-binding protein [Neisseriaceae bacterium]